MDRSSAHPPTWHRSRRAAIWRWSINSPTSIRSGAILYELLAGHPPYMPDGQETTPAQVLTAVQESDADFGLTGKTPGGSELAAICAKAMARERGARYATALDLARDLQAYLDGRVVRAHESGALAAARKWVLRNKALAATGFATAASIVAGLAAVAIIQTKSKNKVEGALAQETAAKESAIKTLADSFLNSGIYEGDADRPDRAALWFAEAARLNPAGSELAALNRARAAEFTYAAAAPVRALQGSKDRTAALDFSGGGRYLLRATIKREIELFDLETERRLALPHPVTAAAFLPGDPRLAVSASPGMVEILALPGFESLQTIRMGEAIGPITGLGISDDGTLMFVGADASYLWNLADGRMESDAIPAFPNLACAATFSPSKRELAANSWRGQNDHYTFSRDRPSDGWVLLKGGASHGELDRANPNAGFPMLPDGSGFIHLLSQTINREGYAPRKFGGRQFNGIAISGDGRLVAAASFEALIQVWEIEAPPRHWFIPQPIAGPIRPVFSPDGKRVLPTGLRCESSLDSARNNLVATRAYDLASGREAGSLCDAGAPILDASFSPDGGMLAFAAGHAERTRETMFLGDGSAGQIQLWDWQNGTRLGEPIPMPSEPRTVRFHPSGDWLAVACAGHHIMRIDLESRAVTQLFRGGGRRTNHGGNNHESYYGPGRVAFASGGDYLLAWDIGDAAYVWDVNRGDFAFPPIGTGSSPNAMAVRGDTLLTTGLFTHDQFGWFRSLSSGEILDAGIQKRLDINAGALDQSGDLLLLSGLGNFLAIHQWRLPGSPPACPDIAVGTRSWCDAEFLDPQPLVMAVASPDDQPPYAQIWDHRTGRALRPRFSPPGGYQVEFLEVAPGSAFAAAS
ncbi:MAG: hypothetical protein R3F11_19075 [Verrucomicrobiales bacterium]